MVKPVRFITYQYFCGQVCLFVLGISHGDFYHNIYHISSLIWWYINKSLFIFMYLYAHQNNWNWTEFYMNYHNFVSVQYFAFMQMISALIVDIPSLSVDSYRKCNELSLSCMIWSFDWSVLMSYQNQLQLTLL